METQSRAEEYRRISLIAHGRIPVSEESPVFNLFAQRREIAKKIKYADFPIETKDHVFAMLDKIEEQIKDYLFL